MALDREQVLKRIEEHGGPEGLDLSGQDLAQADLSRVDLHGAILARADLHGADLRWTNLRDADLQRAVLQKTDLRWADLHDANLHGADLRRANLWWADFTGADLTDVDLTGADMAEEGLLGVTEEVPQALPSPLIRIGMQELRTNQAILAICGGVAALVYFWGWLYKISYLGEFGLPILSAPGFLSAEYFARGWGVITLSLGLLLMLPLLFLYAALMLAILLLIPFAFIYLGDRILALTEDGRVRWAVILTLFLAYLLSFQWLFPRLSPLWGWLLDKGIPAKGGIRVLQTALRSNTLLERALLLLFFAFALGIIWIVYKLFCQTLHRVDVSRYPQFKQIATILRNSRLFAQERPLTRGEQTLIRAVAIALILIIPTFLTQAGKLQAQEDMCYGGDFPLISLYTNKELDLGAVPPPEVTAPGTWRYDCLRLLLFQDDKYHVFYPHQAYESGGKMRPVVYEISVNDVLQATHHDDQACPSCTEVIVTPTPTPTPTPYFLLPTPTATPTPPYTPTPLPTATPSGKVLPTSTVTYTATLTPTAVIMTPTPFVDIYEPDSEENPVPVGPGEVLLRAFYPEDDVDWVSFFVVKGHLYRIMTYDLGPRVDTRIQLRVGDQTFEDDPTLRDPSEILFRAPSDGKVIAKITNTDEQGFAPPGNTYKFMMEEVQPTATPSNTPTPSTTPTVTPTRTRTPTRTLTPTPGKDTYEPNNSFSTAYGPLENDEEYYSFIWSTTDRDYYWFEIGGLDRITVKLSNIPSGTDYDLFLYDANQYEVGRSEGTDDDDKITLSPWMLGKYYVLVRSQNSTYSRAQAYRLKVTYAPPAPTATPTATATVTPTPTRTLTPTPTPTPGKDTYEPNNDFYEAWGPLIPGEVYRSYIWYPGDDDYYWFEIATLDFPIIIYLSNIPSDVDYDLYLFDPDENEVGRSEGTGSTEEIEYVPSVTGIYYILVDGTQQTRETYNNSQPYDLIVFFGQPIPTNTPTPTFTLTPTLTPTPTPSDFCLIYPELCTPTPSVTETPVPTNTPLSAEMSSTETPTPNVAETTVPTNTPLSTETSSTEPPPVEATP
jgi:uncharacterized protein YjbI with pentapeptide repeats